MNEKKGEEKKGEGFIKWFSELSNEDVAIAGGKGASLAEMYNHKFPIPPGFVVTANAYKYFIEKSGISNEVKNKLSKLDVEDTNELDKIANEIRGLIKNSEMPKELEESIVEAYDVLDVNKPNMDRASKSALDILKTGHEPPFVAVRSSATTEDLETASFAGQQETFLNVKGKRQLVQKVKECFASLFTARAVYYRTKKEFAHEKSYLAVVVQRMIDSEKSGVIFSKNPVKDDNSIVIEAVWGLGEGIVSGKIKPDSYIVDSDLASFKIIDLQIADKKIAIVRDSSGNNTIVKLNEGKSKSQVLTNYEIKRLAQHARQLEEHYKKPQDIEFAIAGNEIFIVQSRPITTISKEKKDSEEIEGDILVSGLGASPGIGAGTVKIVSELNELSKVKEGDILVTKMTDPDMVVTMQRAAGIVTDEGGLTSHAAIVSREMGIPAIVGTGNATNILHEGQLVTVDGYTGRVFEGKAKTKIVEIKPVVETRTRIKVIVDLPDFASRAAQSGVRGVGLVRLEGIIATSGKHPLKYIKEKRIEDYIKVLVSGLRKIANYFDDIWIRTSDIRSDEFRNLEGARKEIEGNPMLGNHGIRFSLKNPEIMKAELKAVKNVAEEFLEKKFGVMIPQVISINEVKKTKEFSNEISMPKNVKIGIMVETPAAVQIINELCEEGIDFISFGTNDLTQYTLAIDRNNPEVQDLYDEMNPAVLNSLAYVIGKCKKYGVETSICGQAGSREEMVRFLLSQGIDSISVNADAAYKVSILVSELEKESYIGKPMNQFDEERYNEKALPEEKVDVPSMAVIDSGMQISEINALKEMFSNGNKDKSENKDIEEVVLEEWGNDYMPGDDNKNDIPKLNDAIPVDSEHFNINEQSDNIEEIELKEWKGEQERKEKIEESS